VRIERIRLRDYRGIADHEVVLSDGITVIEGANEAGKSSLVEAIDLLLHYPDSSVDKRVLSVRPVHTGAVPEAEIEIAAGPYRFTYTKRWSDRPAEAATTLRITAPEYDLVHGRQAHERAREIIADHADFDLWKALRVLQDETLDQPALGGKSALMSALDTAAGVGHGTGPDDERNTALIDAAHSEYLRYFTPKKAEPTGEYAKAIAALRTAQNEVHSRQETLDRVTRDIDLYEGAERRLRKLNNAAREAGPELDELEQLHRDLEAATQRLAGLKTAARLARVEADGAASELAIREVLCEEVQSAASDTVALTADAEDKETKVADLRRLASEAEQRAAESRATNVKFDAFAIQAAADRDHLREFIELGRLEERRARADAAASTIKRCVGELATIGLDETAVGRLEKEHQKLVKAQATLDAASSLVEVTAVDGSHTVALDVDGQAASVESGAAFTRRLTSDTTLTIDNLVRIRITPGNAERDQRAKLVTPLEGFAKLCAEYGVTGIDDARAQLARYRDLQLELTGARATVETALDGEGIDSVDERLAALRARTEQYRAARTGPLPEDLDAAEDILATANDAQKHARSAAEQAGVVADTHRNAANKADTNAQVARQRAADADARARQLAAKLTEARESAGDEALLARRQQTAQVCADTDQAWKSAAEAFDPDQLADIALRLDNERAAAKRRDTEIRECENQLAGLAAGLASDRDARERLDEASAQLADATRDHDRVRTRAAAAKRLYTTLDARREAAKLAYVEPFRKKLEQFARIVFGEQLTLVVDRNLTVTHRILGGAKVEYRYLSGGAREQIALCARLACAALVDPDDGVPVVIDDALGFTDPDRLHRIGAVFSATENRSQVIVLTCTPDRYKGIGVAKVLQLHRSLPSSVALPVQRTDADNDVEGGRIPQPPTDENLETARAAVLAVLRDADEPLGKSDVIARCGIGGDQWTAVISALMDDGLVQRHGERRGAKYQAV
jgi:recombinational DNA repair ATPase RecF